MSENTKGIILLIMMFLFLAGILIAACVKLQSESKTYQWDHAEFENHINKTDFDYTYDYWDMDGKVEQ